MEIGLLWFDDSKKRTLEEKVDEARAAYCTKSRFAGKAPDTCFVHRAMLPEGQEAEKYALILHQYEGLSYKEIAEKADIKTDIGHYSAFPCQFGIGHRTGYNRPGPFTA